jgi:hypothetical protein
MNGQDFTTTSSAGQRPGKPSLPSLMHRVRLLALSSYIASDMSPSAGVSGRITRIGRRSWPSSRYGDGFVRRGG